MTESRPVTANALVQRLGTVTRALDIESDHLQLFIMVHGKRHALTTTNFQIDDDGTLLLLKDSDSAASKTGTDNQYEVQALD